MRTVLSALAAAAALAVALPVAASAEVSPAPSNSARSESPRPTPRPGDHRLSPGSPRPGGSPRAQQSPRVLLSPRPSPSPPRLEDVKALGDRVVQERLKLIDRLILQVNAARYLSGADKTALTDELNAAKQSLKALEAKLDADTTLAAARADLKQIQDFKVGGTVVIARGEVVRAADLVLATCGNRLPSLVNKLQDAIAAARAKGLDVSRTADPMADLQAQVKTACADAQAAHDEAVGATTQDQLNDARSKLKAARTALEAAAKDARQVLAVLKAAAGPAGPKPTPTPTHT